jgi:uroporphyrinogen-III synthase
MLYHVIVTREERLSQIFLSILQNSIKAFTPPVEESSIKFHLVPLITFQSLIQDKIYNQNFLETFQDSLSSFAKKALIYTSQNAAQYFGEFLEKNSIAKSDLGRYILFSQGSKTTSILKSVLDRDDILSLDDTKDNSYQAYASFIAKSLTQDPLSGVRNKAEENFSALIFGPQKKELSSKQSLHNELEQRYNIKSVHFGLYETKTRLVPNSEKRTITDISSNLEDEKGIMTFFSPLTFHAALDNFGVNLLNRFTLAAFGKTTSQSIKNLGFNVQIENSGVTEASFAESICKYIALNKNTSGEINQ